MISGVSGDRYPMESNEYLGMGEKVYQPEADNDCCYHLPSYIIRSLVQLHVPKSLNDEYYGCRDWGIQRAPHLLTEGRCGVGGGDVAARTRSSG